MGIGTSIMKVFNNEIKAIIKVYPREIAIQKCMNLLMKDET